MEYYGDRNRYVAGSGTTALGIIGTVAGGAALLNGGNGLGGLFGGGNNSLQKENAALLAEVGQLKSEKYTDAQVANLFNVVRNLEKEQASTNTSVICLQKELTTYETSQREIDELNRKLTNQDIACLASKVENGFIAVNNRFAGVDAAISGFTRTVIPASAICDIGCNSGCTATQQ